MSNKIAVPIQKSFWVVGQGNARDLQNNIGYTLALASIPENTTHSFLGIGGILLDQPSPPHPWGLLSLITEGPVQSANGEEQSVLLLREQSALMPMDLNKDQDDKLFWKVT